MAVPDSFGIYLPVVKDLMATWLSERKRAQHLLGYQRTKMRRHDVFVGEL